MARSPSTLATDATARALVSCVPLVALWALAFTGVAPFYPTIMAGAAAMVALAAWVRRAPTVTPVRFPGLRLGVAEATLAVGVAIVHYLVGLGLFVLASRLVPAFAATASTAYDRAGTVPLWAAVVLGGLVSAPLEEVFWRGAVQPVVTAAASMRWSLVRHHPLVAVALAAVVYGLFHAATWQLALVSAALLGGLVWGWLLHRTRSLGAVMIAHGLWTTLMLVIPPG